MSHQASCRFWRHFDELTPDLQKLARVNYELLKANPQHPFWVGTHEEYERLIG